MGQKTLSSLFTSVDVRGLTRLRSTSLKHCEHSPRHVFGYFEYHGSRRIGFVAVGDSDEVLPLQTLKEADGNDGENGQIVCALFCILERVNGGVSNGELASGILKDKGSSLGGIQSPDSSGFDVRGGAADVCDFTIFDGDSRRCNSEQQDEHNNLLHSAPPKKLRHAA
jgi:hypothetical protein